MSPLNRIDRILKKKNIDVAIETYKELLSEIPLSISGSNILEFITSLKRTKINKGPYPNVTLFEAANRIMTDLVILYGVKQLLDGVIPEFKFNDYMVELGNENNNGYDIQARNGKRILIGEAFNVAQSFFQGKKTAMIKKLREDKEKNTMLLLLFNADAVKDNYKPNLGENEFYLPVNISF